MSSSLGAYALDALVGVSPWVCRLRCEILKLAEHSSTVLITGPTGTGKELIARAIHAHSRRAEKTLIPVDCAAISGSLFLSHMFGHVKGAFTGATYAALGCFRAADGGTIFLDEIGELEFDLQAKLLRVLQERVVVPAGSHVGVPVDVRLITATNRDLKREVAEGRFRADLYYRLSVMTVATLPLRDRLEDIEYIANHVFARLAIRHGIPLKSLSADALELLIAYDWPGNIRELENVLEQVALSFEESQIDSQAILQILTDHRFEQYGAKQESCINPNQSLELPSIPAQTPPAWQTMAEVECEHIRRTLEYTNGNQSAAAKLLQIDRNLLRRKMSRYHLVGISYDQLPPRPAA